VLIKSRPTGVLQFNCSVVLNPMYALVTLAEHLLTSWSVIPRVWLFAFEDKCLYSLHISWLGTGFMASIVLRLFNNLESSDNICTNLVHHLDKNMRHFHVAIR